MLQVFFPHLFEHTFNTQETIQTRLDDNDDDHENQDDRM